MLYRIKERLLCEFSNLKRGNEKVKRFCQKTSIYRGLMRCSITNGLFGGAHVGRECLKTSTKQRRKRSRCDLILTFPLFDLCPSLFSRFIHSTLLGITFYSHSDRFFDRKMSRFSISSSFRCAFCGHEPSKKAKEECMKQTPRSVPLSTISSFTQGQRLVFKFRFPSFDNNLSKVHPLCLKIWIHHRLLSIVIPSCHKIYHGLHKKCLTRAINGCPDC